MNGSAAEMVQEITQAVLAVLTVAGALAVAVLLISRGSGTGDIPAWLALGVGAVIGFYFGSRGQNSTIATMANGPLHLIAAMNQRQPRRAGDPIPTDTEQEATT